MAASSGVRGIVDFVGVVAAAAAAVDDRGVVEKARAERIC